jgi:uncharacterized glyoxalase superfamily protein PhnB
MAVQQNDNHIESASFSSRVWRFWQRGFASIQMTANLKSENSLQNNIIVICFQRKDIPMFQLAQLVPIIPSPDIASSLRFYQALGFSNPWLWTGKGERIHDSNTSEQIVYGGLDTPNELHFHHVGDKTILENAMLRIAVTGDMGAFYQHCLDLGCIHPNSKLERKPWGRLEFTVLDPAGVCVSFWQELT